MWFALPVALLAFTLPACGVPRDPPAGQSRHMDEAKIKRATEVKDRHIDSLMKLPAVVGAGIGASRQHPDEVAIVLYLTRALKPKERRRFPRVLEGVPVETLVTGPFTERRKQ